MKTGHFYLVLLLAALCIVCSCAPRRTNLDIGAQNMTMRDAMESYAQGDCRNSMDLFSILVSAGNNPIYLNGLGMAQLQCGQNTQAIDSFKKAVALSPGSADLHANLGAAYFASGNLRGAGNEFEIALRNDPANPEALLGKAGVLLEKGQADKALAVMKQLPAAARQSPEALFDRALMLYKLGIYEDAESALRECLAKNGGDAAVYNALAITLLGLKRNREALEAINRAIAEDPMDGKYYYNRGNIHRALKDFPRAIKDYGRAIAYNPGFAEAFVNRGDLLFLEKDQKAGCKDLEEACRLGLCERLDNFKEMGRCLSGIWQ